MSLKNLSPFLLILTLVSCRPETPGDVVSEADPVFVEGLIAMSAQRDTAKQASSPKITSKLDISAEGTVNEASSLLGIFLDDISSNGEGGTQMIYFGPYSSRVTTSPFYFNDKTDYYIQVQLIDTAQWARYTWSPEAPVKVKPEMKLHLLHNNLPASKQIELE